MLMSSSPTFSAVAASDATNIIRRLLLPLSRMGTPL
jgi:hypothetical protein